MNFPRRCLFLSFQGFPTKLVQISTLQNDQHLTHQVSAKKAAKSEDASASRFLASLSAGLSSGVVPRQAAEAFSMLLLSRESVSNLGDGWAAVSGVRVQVSSGDQHPAIIRKLTHHIPLQQGEAMPVFKSN